MPVILHNIVESLRILAPALLAFRTKCIEGITANVEICGRYADSTLALFANEYAVPLLPPDIAAYLGAAAELCLPPLLALGFAGRLTALALFVFNIVAVTSYPDISDAGIKDHILWGALLAVVFFHGPGKLSVDHLLSRFFARRG